MSTEPGIEEQIPEGKEQLILMGIRQVITQEFGKIAPAKISR